MIRAHSLNLVTILRDSALANRDAKTSAMYFEDHLKKYVAGSWEVSPLIMQQRNAALQRLKEKFGVG